MFRKIKNFLKRILPPPVRTFNREIERIISSIKKVYEQEKKQTERIERISQDVNLKLENLTSTIEKINSGLSDIQKQHTQHLSEHKAVLDRLEKAHVTADEAKRYASEATWAAIFNNSIADSTWLKNKTFSPGRWAVGYPALYVMYRVLNEFRPKHILELGLGQSTRMIAQYVSANPNVEHYVVEHDPEWISFFKNDFELSDRTEIVQLKLDYASCLNKEKIRVFSGFKKFFSEKQFDFVFIDAPLGADMKELSRIDVLSILPECLKESFVMVIDDSDRQGEKNTIREIENVLRKHSVEYYVGAYRGIKEITLFASKDNSFLISL